MLKNQFEDFFAEKFLKREGKEAQNIFLYGFQTRHNRVYKDGYKAQKRES